MLSTASRLAGALLGLIVAFVISPTHGADKVVLQREWTANAEFAGDVWASRLAAVNGVNLEVREGSDIIDPLKTVRSGQAQFGVASADRILRENEAGADLLIIAAATYRSPVVFLTRPGLGITGPSQFVGRTIGIQPGTNTELVLQALAHAQKLALKDMKIVDAGWGTQLLETRKIDVLGAFAYDEPIALKLKNFAVGQTIVPEDHGVQYVGTVYFTTKQFARARPELVQAFMDALVKGWQNALDKPETALTMLAENFQSVRANLAKERLSFEAGRPYFSGEEGRLLYASKARWTAMAASMRELGKLKAFDFDANVDYRFLEQAVRK